MITLMIITVVIWTLIRIVQLVTLLWRIVDAEISPRVGTVAAA